MHRQEQKAYAATINKELSALKRIPPRAEGPQGKSLVPEISMLPEDNVREQFIEPSQFVQLIEALPERYRDPVEFLWLSAWRVGEMRSLTWALVDADAIRLRRENSKSKRAREIRLVGELAALIKRARARRRADCEYVFYRTTKNRKSGIITAHQIGNFTKIWATATKAAGLKGLWVHDLRCSAIRHLMRSGASQTVAMSISGHRTISIFQCYDITSGDDQARALLNMEEYRKAAKSVQDQADAERKKALDRTATKPPQSSEVTAQ